MHKHVLTLLLPQHHKSTGEIAWLSLIKDLQYVTYLMLNSFISDDNDMILISVLLRRTEVLFLVSASTTRKQLGQMLRQAHLTPKPVCFPYHVASQCVWIACYSHLGTLSYFPQEMNKWFFSKVSSTFSSAFEYQRVSSPVAWSQDWVWAVSKNHHDQCAILCSHVVFQGLLLL